MSGPARRKTIAARERRSGGDFGRPNPARGVAGRFCAEGAGRARVARRAAPGACHGRFENHARRPYAETRARPGARNRAARTRGRDSRSLSPRTLRAGALGAGHPAAPGQSRGGRSPATADAQGEEQDQRRTGGLAPRPSRGAKATASPELLAAVELQPKSTADLDVRRVCPRRAARTKPRPPATRGTSATASIICDERLCAPGHASSVLSSAARRTSSVWSRGRTRWRACRFHAEAARPRRSVSTGDRTGGG